MNLINFKVTEIISEERDIIYKLMHYTEEDIQKFRNDEDMWWYDHIHSNGCKQIYKYHDDGGYNTRTEIFNLDAGQAPREVGYIGLH